jgi:hypothetical protein
VLDNIGYLFQNRDIVSALQGVKGEKVFGQGAQPYFFRIEN